MKEVTFQGIQYSVPDWANWIAQDAYGVIRVYSTQPWIDGNRWRSAGNEMVVGGASAPMVKEAI